MTNTDLQVASGNQIQAASEDGLEVVSGASQTSEAHGDGQVTEQNIAVGFASPRATLPDRARSRIPVGAS